MENENQTSGGEKLFTTATLVDAIYRTYDWNRHTDNRRSGPEGEHALALYDNEDAFFLGFFSDNAVDGKPLATERTNREAVVSRFLLETLIECEEEEFARKAVAGKSKGGAIVPSFMKKAEDKMKASQFNQSTKDAIITRMNDTLLQRSNFVPNAVEHYSKLKTKNQQQERAAFGLSNNQCFSEAHRRLDAMLRTAAYDVARHHVKPVKKWSELTDADIAAIANMVYDGMYSDGTRPMRVRSDEWHEEKIKQRADVIAKPRLSEVVAKDGKLHPFEAVMRRELKRIRKQKMGCEYPKCVGLPHVEFVGADHDLLIPQINTNDAKKAENAEEKAKSLAKGLLGAWTKWGYFVDYEINDGSDQNRAASK